MIDEYTEWDETQKMLAHWLRRKHNKSLHKGEPPWEEKSAVIEKLLLAYLLTSQVYTRLGYKIFEVFDQGEQSILGGREAGWKETSRFLANIAFQFYEDDPEMAIQISNAAMENAIRGLADCW